MSSTGQKTKFYSPYTHKSKEYPIEQVVERAKGANQATTTDEQGHTLYKFVKKDRK